ncbi:MAG: spermidine synthase [Candidatus Omnitrophota bacterium]
MEKSLRLNSIYFITLVSAACSMVYELLLAQTVSFFCANTVIWYSLVIGIYLGAMGWGALSYGRMFKKIDHWDSLIQVEFLLSVIGGLSAIVLYVIHMIIRYIWIKNNFYDLSWLFFGGVFLAVVVIGVLSGCELPLLMKIGNKYSQNKNISNRILSVDYLGALIGAIVFPLILLARFELITIGMLVAAVNILLAGYLQICQKRYALKLTVSTVMAGALIVGLVCSRHIEQYFLKKYYYYYESSSNAGALFKPMKEWPPIKRLSSPYQKIDLVYYPPKEDIFEDLWEAYSQKFKLDPRFPKGYVLFIDGFFQFLLDIENINHEYFAHVPIILNEKIPEKVLVLGAGDGLLLRELVQYKEMKEITLVEIDPLMVELASNDQILVYANKEAFKDGRVRVVIEDAYHFLRTTQEKYDAIYMDFPRAKDYNLSKLYSREFYSFIYSCLKDDGFIVFDATEIADSYQDHSWEVYFSTLTAAGFRSVIPFFSTLESDNLEAIQLLSSMFKETHQLRVTQENSKEVKVIAGRAAIVKKIIQDFIQDHQNSFIMSKKLDGKINRTYNSFGIDHLILNEKRFNLTLDRPHIINDLPSDNLINSVTRPTLPRNSSLWKMRVPY